MRAILAEEMGRTLHECGRSPDVLGAGNEARPCVAAADETSRDGVGEGVGDFVEDGFWVGEEDSAVGAWSPEGFRAAVEGVEGASDEEVEAVLEEGEESVGVGQDDVVVVGEDDEGVEEDAVAVGSECEAVEDDVIDEGVWFEEEASLGAAAGDEVGSTWDDGTRRGHAWRHKHVACQGAGRVIVMG